MWMIYYRFMDLRDIVLKYISVQFFYSAASSHEIYDICAYTNIWTPFMCSKLFFFFVIDR